MREKEPSMHFKTARQAMFEELLKGMKTVRELSQAIGISEKEVIENLTHVEKSAVQRGYKFIIKPSECLKCGFVFQRRERLRKPGRCPKCKGELLTSPGFEIKDKKTEKI